MFEFKPTNDRFSFLRLSFCCFAKKDIIHPRLRANGRGRCVSTAIMATGISPMTKYFVANWHQLQSVADDIHVQSHARKQGLHYLRSGFVHDFRHMDYGLRATALLERTRLDRLGRLFNLFRRECAENYLLSVTGTSAPADSIVSSLLGGIPMVESGCGRKLG